MKGNQSWRDRLELVLVFFFIALLVRTFVFTTYRLGSDSMRPSLLEGDFIVASRLPYGLKVPLTRFKIAGRLPARGEVVVYSVPNMSKEYLSRVVAVAGDRIEIKKGHLILNEVPLEYSHSKALEPGLEAALEKAPEGIREVFKTSAWNGKNFGPEVVPPDTFYLMNDFRGYEAEMGPWSAVSLEQIEAKFSFIWFSVGRDQNARPELRWKRILESP